MTSLSLLSGGTVSRLILRKYWLGVPGLPLMAIYTLRPAFLLVDLRDFLFRFRVGEGGGGAGHFQSFFQSFFQSLFLISQTSKVNQQSVSNL